MCELRLPLVAWMDGELTASETAAVEEHVQACAECRQRVSECREASRGFAEYYGATSETASATNGPRRWPRWVGVAVAAAAAIVVGLLLYAREERQAPVAPRAATVATSPAVEVASEAAGPVQQAPRVAKRRVAAHRQAQREDWAMEQPAIQIALPADSMFPPGAVPEGAAYIANVSFAADGSIQSFRLRP